MQHLIYWTFLFTSLCFIHSQPLFKVPISNQPVQFGSLILGKWLSDPTFVDRILHLKDPTTVDINAYNLLPEAIIQFALKNDVHSFSKIFARENLVKWDIEKVTHYNEPMDYKVHLIHVGDLSDIARVLLRPNALDLNRFNPLISDEILEIFVNFLLSNMDHLSSEIRHQDHETKVERLVSCLVRYLGFHGRDVELISVLMRLYQKQLQVAMDTPLIYALQRGHIHLLKTVLEEGILSVAIYDAVWEFCCISGNMECLELLVKDPLLPQKTSFDRETVFSTFHGHEKILKLFQENAMIVSKIPKELLEKSLAYFEQKSSLSHSQFMKSYLKDQPLIDLLNIAADASDSQFITFVLKHLDSDGTHRLKVASDAAYLGDIQMIDFVLREDVLPPGSKKNKAKVKKNALTSQILQEVLLKAAGFNQVSVLEFVRNKYAGRNDVITWQIAIEEPMSMAILNGNVESFQFFMKHYAPFLNFYNMVLDFLAVENLPFSTRMFCALFMHPRIQSILPDTAHLMQLDLNFIKMARNDIKSLQLFMNNLVTCKLFRKSTWDKLIEDAFARQSSDLVYFLMQHPLFQEWHTVEEMKFISDRSEITFKNPRYGYMILNEIVMDSLFLKEILEPPKTSISLNQMNSYQHLPQALIEFAKMKEFKKFQMILQRPDLVDWSLDHSQEPRLALNYKVFLMHPGDILELTREFIKNPPLNSPFYSKYDLKFTDAFVTFLLQSVSDMDPRVNSKTQDILYYLADYLLFYGRALDFEKFMEEARAKVSDFLPNVELYYAFQKNYGPVLQVIVTNGYLNEKIYKKMFSFSCIFGNVETLESLLGMDALLKTKESFRIDLIQIAFHQHKQLFDLLSGNEVVKKSISESEWTRFQGIMSSDPSEQKEKVLAWIQQDPEKWMTHISNTRDVEMTKYLISKIEFKDQITQQHVINGIARQAAFHGIFELIDHLLPLYHSFCHIPMVESATFGNQEEVLDHLLQFHRPEHEQRTEMTLVISIFNYHFDILDVYMKYYPEDVTPLWIVNVMITSGKMLLPTRYLVKLLDEKELNANVDKLPKMLSKTHFILELAEKDLLSLQFILMNYYTRDWIRKSDVYKMVQSAIQNSNPALLRFILSEKFLFDQLTIYDWKVVEHQVFSLSNRYAGSSLLKKTFKLSGSVMHKLHFETLRKQIMAQ